MMFLFVLFVVAFFMLYLQAYFKVPSELQIIQTSLEQLHPDMLLEKQPIYVYDEIYNPADVIATTFKYQYLNKTLSLSNRDYLKKNLSRFLLIYNDSDNIVEVDISSPHRNHEITFYSGLFVNKFYKVAKSSNTENFTKVKLKPSNMFVLPLNWMYKTKENNILEIHLFDMISKGYSFVA